MEQGRLLIAIALSFLVFFLWNAFFADQEAVQKKPAEPPQQSQRTEDRVSQTGGTGDTPPSAPETDVQPGTPAPTEVDTEVDAAASPPPGFHAEPSREISVETPLYTAKISERGALIRAFVLKRYRQHPEEGSPLLNMIDGANNPGSGIVNFLGNSAFGLEKAEFLADVDQDHIRVENQERTLRFVWSSPQGLVLEKRFTFSPTGYTIGLEVVVKNGSGQSFQDPLGLTLTKWMPKSQTRIGFEGPSALVNGKHEKVALDDIEDKGQISGDIRWIAIQDQYFMSSLIPKKSTETSIRMNLRNKGLVENQFVQPLKALAPGAQTAVSYFLYFGPKSLKILSGTPYQLDKAIDFGWFTVIAKPCVWLMNQLYRFIPNYGVVIIILTLLIKLLLWPLGNKSYRSMAEMKKLQPLMAEIREKYKDDKKKMNEEMMALYRTYKVNPMGGCLPMALQIPVFIAFYRMLYGAIELRHAPFFGWITDLSAPDRLFRFDFTVPFMQPPYGIPVLTVIMGATMFLQQKMSPPPGDPAQAKMMMLMPVVFTVIFINFPAGLVLYWLVNNIVSIGQQYYVTKKRA